MTWLILFSSVWYLGQYTVYYEPQHDKTTKWLCSQQRQISLGIHPVWSESSLSHEEAWVLSYPLDAQSFCWFCHDAAQLCWIWSLLFHLLYLMCCFWLLRGYFRCMYGIFRGMQNSLLTIFGTKFECFLSFNFTVYKIVLFTLFLCCCFFFRIFHSLFITFVYNHIHNFCQYTCSLAL